MWRQAYRCKPQAGASAYNPGNIGPTSAPKKHAPLDQKNTQNLKKKSNSKDIWDVDEVLASSSNGANSEDIYDPRPQPDYEMMYKQATSTEDVFLGLGNKTPATFSCEDLIVKIKLPNTKVSDIELEIKKSFLDCRTPTHKLGLHLPYPADERESRADWDQESGELRVTLRLMRDMDPVNF